MWHAQNGLASQIRTWPSPLAVQSSLRCCVPTGVRWTCTCELPPGTSAAQCWLSVAAQAHALAPNAPQASDDVAPNPQRAARNTFAVRVTAGRVCHPGPSSKVRSCIILMEYGDIPNRMTRAAAAGGQIPMSSRPSAYREGLRKPPLPPRKKPRVQGRISEQLAPVRLSSQHFFLLTTITINQSPSSGSPHFQNHCHADKVQGSAWG